MAIGFDPCAEGNRAVAHPNPIAVLSHITVDTARPDGMVATRYSSLYSADHRETIRGLRACLDFGFLIISIVALSNPTVAENLETELQTLNDAKNAAIEADGSLDGGETYGDR